MREKVAVAIVGAGPAGLLLAHVLAAAGVSFVLIEHRSRERVLARVRAGVLEQSTVDALDEYGLADRLHREGLVHGGIHLQFEGERVHVDFEHLVGRTVTVYGQQEVVADLIAAHDALGSPVHFGVQDVTPAGVDTDSPTLGWLLDGEQHVVDADFVVGVDGDHGVCRGLIPADVLDTTSRDFDNAWLGILADVPPSTDELIYALHPRGFAMHSMRGTTVSRLYLQVEPDEDIANWSDERIWDELDTRLGVPGWTLKHGPVTEKGITPMRGAVAGTLRYGRLFLAGDAGHIVPPTGAKGLNGAVADVVLLGEALVAQHRGDDSLLATYSARALERQWKVQYFSQWMTDMLHAPGARTTPDEAAFRYRSRVGQLRFTTGSTSALTTLAEQYTGLPIR